MAEQQQLQPGQTEEPAETGFFDRLFSGDKPLWIIVISLAIISLLVVYSSTASMAYKNAGGNTAHYFFNQLKFIAIGFVIMWFVHRINYQRYVRFTVVLFILALGFMLLTFVIGVNLNSASRWIRIPIIGMTFQPSDFMRVTLVALLAQQLAKRQKVIDKIPILPALTPGGWRKNPRKNRDILFDTTIPLLGPVVVACGAIFFSNFSTAALTFFTCWVMLFIGRVRVRELWRLIALVVVVMAAAVTVMYMFNIGRSHTWVNRLGLGDALSKTEQVQVQNDEDNLQEEQAQIAIASGGITGKGPGNSTQRSNLPHAYSDFAYAFIVEEYGLVGSVRLFPGNRNLPAVRNGAAEPAGFGPQPDDHVAGADQYDGVGGLFSGDRADVAADQSRRFVCGIYEFVVGDYPRREPPDERAVARPPQRRVLAGVGVRRKGRRTAVGTGIWKTVGLWRERP